MIISRRCLPACLRSMNFSGRRALNTSSIFPVWRPPARIHISSCQRTAMAISTGLYDLWRDDLRNGRYVYIRYFENLLQLLAGFQPEECGAAGVCSMQFLVESDGNVYPCDFFVEETYCLGNLHRDTLKDITKKLNGTDFIRSSWMLPEECRLCPFLSFCRGSCKQYRNKSGRYLCCQAVRRFFSHALDDMKHLLDEKRT